MDKNNKNIMLEEILSLSKILIAIPTVTGDERSLELAVEIAYQDLYDYNVKKFKHNGISSLLYYNTEQIPERFRVLLTTNLDVVSAHESQFKPYEKDGKLYGRGAYDVKGASAAMILAYKEIAKKVDYPVGLQIVADGEYDSKNIKHQISEGVRADFVISAIPTNFGISHMSKGMLWIKVRTTGKGAHSASPWKGENAILKMKHFLNKLEQTFPDPKEEMWATTVNVAKISTTNDEFNNVPDNCEVLLDIRYIPEDEKIILSKIKNLLPEGFEYETTLHDQSESTDLENKEFKLLYQAVEETIGKKPKVIKKHYGDSIRYFTSVGGFGASIGPIGGNEHGEDEWVDIKSLADYYQALKKFLLKVE
ncbi:MAG TPA: M20/M25/M40 family metallo-hydrolase [Candidatus Saccharimonadales bacterium]|nr:M20/M25/M40 family metallo-hydrolase [Candidatus Saccharimonadales bacterium]